MKKGILGGPHNFDSIDIFTLANGFPHSFHYRPGFPLYDPACVFGIPPEFTSISATLSLIEVYFLYKSGSSFDEFLFCCSAMLPENEPYFPLAFARSKQGQFVWIECVIEV